MNTDKHGCGFTAETRRHGAGVNHEDTKGTKEAGALGLRHPTLPVRTVERLHALLAGDPVTEGMVLVFIGARYGARNLFFLPTKVAEQVLRRPTDFMRAAKQHCEPQLNF